MGYPLRLALRYLGSKKRASISVGTAFAILGVALGVAALLTVMSVTGGFQAEFREKVLGVNAHVLVLKHSPEFRNYRDVMERVRRVKGVVNVAPFSINPMMLSHGEKVATGVLVKGVDPEASLGVGAPEGVPPVLDLPRHVVRGEGGECKRNDMQCGIRMLSSLRREGAAPPGPRYEPNPTPNTPRPTAPAASDVPADKTGANTPDPGSGYTDPVVKKGFEYLEEEAKRKAAARGSSSAPSPVEAAPDPSEVVSAWAAAPSADAPAPLPPKKKEKGGKKAPKKTSSEGEPTEPAPSTSASAAPPEGPKFDVPSTIKSEIPDEGEEILDLPKDPCADPEDIKKLPGIVVGVSLAETLDLKLGSCVTISSPTIGFQFSGGAIKAPVSKSFRVMAMFEAGFDQYDSKLVYTDLYEAQTFYDEGDTVTGVEMKIDDIDASDEVVEAVKQVLPGCAEDTCGYRIMDWKELNHGLFTALLIQQIGMSGVLALIILVAAFTVVATLIMVVLDKKKEISVLKAMGAKDSAILRVFLYQGGIIGGLGTSLGLLIGFAVCKGLLVWAFPLDPKVYFISQLPVLMRWQEFAITGAVALTLCLLATVIPSLYAANIRPAEGFREQ